MRRLNKVEMLPQRDYRVSVSPSSLLRTPSLSLFRQSPFRHLLLGPGSTWERVLSIVPDDKVRSKSSLHVNHQSVIVHGHSWPMLGRGRRRIPPRRRGQHRRQFAQIRNGLGTRGGVHSGGGQRGHFEGQRAQCHQGGSLRTRIRRDGGIEGKRTAWIAFSFHAQVVPSSGENDLFFALKGAGSSYGIATEFLYRIHKTPETRPVVMFLILESLHDVRKLEAISRKGLFQVRDKCKSRARRNICPPFAGVCLQAQPFPQAHLRDGQHGERKGVPR